MSNRARETIICSDPIVKLSDMAVWAISSAVDSTVSVVPVPAIMCYETSCVVFCVRVPSELECVNEYYNPCTSLRSLARLHL